MFDFSGADPVEQQAALDSFLRAGGTQAQAEELIRLCAEMNLVLEKITEIFDSLEPVTYVH